MAITAVQLAVVLVIFLAMYKKLAPLIHTGDFRETADDESEDEIELGPVGNGVTKYQPLSQEGTQEEENELESEGLDVEEPLLFPSVVEEPT